MMNKKKLGLLTGIIASIGLSLSIATTDALAAEGPITEHPHPTLLDKWTHGITSNNWAYSNYYLYDANAGNLGSQASITDIYGNVHSIDRKNYGEANAGATKQWWWIRAEAYYAWYNF